jgi:hypothetical protein
MHMKFKTKYIYIYINHSYNTMYVSTKYNTMYVYNIKIMDQSNTVLN